MDRTQSPHATPANDAWFDSGLPELGPFARETATPWEQPEPEPTPLPHNEEEMDGVIFAALVSPYA